MNDVSKKSFPLTIASNVEYRSAALLDGQYLHPQTNSLEAYYGMAIFILEGTIDSENEEQYTVKPKVVSSNLFPMSKNPVKNKAVPGQMFKMIQNAVNQYKAQYPVLVMWTQGLTPETWMPFSRFIPYLYSIGADEMLPKLYQMTSNLKWCVGGMGYVLVSSSNEEGRFHSDIAVEKASTGQFASAELSLTISYTAEINESKGKKSITVIPGIQEFE